MPCQEPAQSERKRVREESHQETRVGQSSAAQKCPRAEMPSRPVDLSLSPAEAAGDVGEEKQHGEKGKQWNPGSIALQLVPRPFSLLSEGGNTALSRSGTSGWLKTPWLQHTAGRRDLSCSVKGSDFWHRRRRAQPSPQTPLQGPPPGDEGVALPTSFPTDTVLLPGEGDETSGQCASPGSCSGTGWPHPSHVSKMTPTQGWGSTLGAQAAIWSVLLPHPSASGHKAALQGGHRRWSNAPLVTAGDAARCSSPRAAGLCFSQHSGRRAAILSPHKALDKAPPHQPTRHRAALPTPAGWTGGSSAQGMGRSTSMPAH